MNKRCILWYTNASQTIFSDFNHRQHNSFFVANSISVHFQIFQNNEYFNHVVFFIWLFFEFESCRRLQSVFEWYQNHQNPKKYWYQNKYEDRRDGLFDLQKRRLVELLLATYFMPDQLHSSLRKLLNLLKIVFEIKYIMVRFYAPWIPELCSLFICKINLSQNFLFGDCIEYWKWYYQIIWFEF